MGDGKTHAKEYTKEHMSVPYNINILIHTRTLYSMAGYGHAVFLGWCFLATRNTNSSLFFPDFMLAYKKPVKKAGHANEVKR